MPRLSDRLWLRRGTQSTRILDESTSSGLAAVQAQTVAENGPPPPVLRDLQREFPVGALGDEEHSVSRLLYERLGDEEIARLEQLLRDSRDFAAVGADSEDPALRRMLALHCGMWYGIDSVAARTGLHPDQPPEDVHAMARGPLSAAGGLYEADLVADALRSVGADIARGGAALDFGSSSGRVVRVLAAAFPDVRWSGCDPNRRAIEWASGNIPGIRFFCSGNEPPLPLESGVLQLAFGISIWSHFEPQLGLRWLDEMRRLLVPGGHLVMTTHGLTSVAHYAANGLRPPQQCEEIADALYRWGWWYAPEFGEKGDWGVVNPDWGTAFVTPEWLLAELSPHWRFLQFAPGRNAGNQDVFVLQRA